MRSMRLSPLLLALVGALLLAACGGDAQPAQITPTTPVEFVNAAADKTLNIKSYRLSFSSMVTASGMPNPVKETLSGDFEGADAHYRYAGPANQSINLAEDQAVEVMIVDGTSYVRGPVEAWGAPEDRWYIYSVNKDAQLAPPSKLSVLIQLLGRRDLRFVFVKAGSEQLDGSSCDRYDADHETAIALINELAHPSSLTNVEKTIVQATPESHFSVWRCADGYIHKIDVDVQGADAIEQAMGFQLLLELTEVDRVPELPPPPDAIQTVPQPEP